MSLSPLAFSALIVIGTLVVLPSTTAGVPLRKASELTLSTAVRLPGVVLRPGKYAFESSAVAMNPGLVRVTGVDYRTVHYQGFTQRIQRPEGMDPGTVISFDEAPEGAPKPIAAWFPLGSRVGHRFIYR
jgi:hypothetical protein